MPLTLSEELADIPLVRLASDRVWIVDPLDGSRQLAETGRADRAVHVAPVDSRKLEGYG